MGAGRGDGEKWSDCDSSLKVDPVGFVDRPEGGWERRRDTEDDFMVWGLTNGKSGAAPYREGEDWGRDPGAHCCVSYSLAFPVCCFFFAYLL